MYEHIVLLNIYINTYIIHMASASSYIILDTKTYANIVNDIIIPGILYELYSKKNMFVIINPNHITSKVEFMYYSINIISKENVSKQFYMAMSPPGTNKLTIFTADYKYNTNITLTREFMKKEIIRQYTEQLAIHDKSSMPEHILHDKAIDTYFTCN